MAETPKSRSAVSIAALYLLTLLGAAAIFYCVQRAGVGLVAPSPQEGIALFNPGQGGGHASTLLHILIALPIIVIAARLLGMAFKRLGQPAVMGEVVAGILLGPTLLGRLWPQGAAFLLPNSVAPFLQVIAQIGVIIFMFLVGLELNTRRLRHDSHATVAISHASIVAPFVLGSMLALWLYPRFSSSDVPFTIFALFMGVAMSVTALPVLARILSDRGLSTTPLGTIALTCAAVDDVSAWCLLALVVSIARDSTMDALTTLGLVIAFVAVMLIVIRPLLSKLVQRTNQSGQLSQDSVAVIFLVVLASALATEAIGIHALFGAFLVGVIIPHDSVIATEIRRRLSDIVSVLLLPVFFAYAGMRTQIGLLESVEEWLICGVIVAVACLGKLGGSAVAARFAGMSWRGAAALGILMNTRGLMQLIVLNVGLDLGVLSPKLFAMLVIMAVVTTLLTSPVLQYLIRGRESAVMGDSIGGSKRASLP